MPAPVSSFPSSRGYANAARGGAASSVASPAPASAASLSPSPSASPPAASPHGAHATAANGAGSGRGKDYGYDHGKPGKKPTGGAGGASGGASVASGSASAKAVPPYAAPLPRVVASDESQPRINLMPKIKAQGKARHVSKADIHSISTPANAAAATPAAAASPTTPAAAAAAGPSPLPTPSPISSPSPRPAFPDPRPSPAPATGSPSPDVSHYQPDGVQLVMRGAKLSDPLATKAAPQPQPQSQPAGPSSDVPASAIVTPAPQSATSAAATDGVQQAEQQLAAMNIAPQQPPAAAAPSSSSAAAPSSTSPLLPMHPSASSSPSTHSLPSQQPNGGHSVRTHPQHQQPQAHMRRHQPTHKHAMLQQQPFQQQQPQAHMQQQQQQWMNNHFHAQPYPQQFPQPHFHPQQQQRQPQFHHPAMMFNPPPPFYGYPGQQHQQHPHQQGGFVPREPRVPHGSYEGGARPRVTFTATGKRNEICHYWQQGKCYSMNEPQRCQFLHGENDTSEFVREMTPVQQQQAQQAHPSNTDESGIARPSVVALSPDSTAAVSPLASFGGWLAHDRVHRFRDLVILEKSNATADDVAAATAAAAAAADGSPDAPVVPLEPVKPLPASQYVTTLLVHHPALSNTAFHSVVRQSDRSVLVRLLRDVCALLEQQHHIMDFHFRVQERRAEVMTEGERAVLTAAAAGEETAAAAGEDESVVSARAHIANPSNFHIRILFGGRHTPLPTRPTCMSCDVDDPKLNGSLLEKRPYNHVWLDAQGRSMVVVTPYSHYERLSALNDDQLYALYGDAYELLSSAQDYTSRLSGPAASSLVPFVYDHLILNHGLYRNFAHLHLKCRLPPRVWAIMATRHADAGAGTDEEQTQPFLMARYAKQMAEVERMKTDVLLKKSGMTKANAQSPELVQPHAEQQPQAQQAHPQPYHSEQPMQLQAPMHAAWDYQQQPAYGYAPSPYYPPMQHVHPAHLQMMMMQQQQQQQQQAQAGGDRMQFPRLLFPMQPQHGHPFSPQQLQAAYLQAAAQAQAQAQAAQLAEAAHSNSATPAAPSTASPMLAAAAPAGAGHSSGAPPLLPLPVAALPTVAPPRSAPASPALAPSAPLLPAPTAGNVLAPAAVSPATHSHTSSAGSLPGQVSGGIAPAALLPSPALSTSSTPPQPSMQQAQAQQAHAAQQAPHMRPNPMWSGGPNLSLINPALLHMFAGGAPHLMQPLMAGVPLQSDPYGAQQQQAQQLALHASSLPSFPPQMSAYGMHPYPQFGMHAHAMQSQFAQPMQGHMAPHVQTSQQGQGQGQGHAPSAGANNGPTKGKKKRKHKGPRTPHNEMEGSNDNTVQGNE